jgi:Gly-Xaa carboxypeptidase
LLLESGKFKPQRTVVVALGIDEETGGKVGATNLGYWIEDKYGKDSMCMLVDEGSGMTEVWGQVRFHNITLNTALRHASSR